jgi:hypothetical protein
MKFKSKRDITAMNLNTKIEIYGMVSEINYTEFKVICSVKNEDVYIALPMEMFPEVICIGMNIKIITDEYTNENAIVQVLSP